jgi:hypothetical protein
MGRNRRAGGRTGIGCRGRGTARRLLAVAVLAAGSAGCLGACQKPDTSGQVTRGFYSPDFDTVWEVSEREMARAGFSPDPDASSRATRTLVSRWEAQMSPFSARGHREKATVVLHPVPGTPDRWTVEVNVTRETNMAIVNPSNPVVAKWENPTRVGDREHMLAENIERFFVPRDVSPEFRTRYGMPAAPRTTTPAPTPASPPPSSDPSFPWK